MMNSFDARDERGFALAVALLAIVVVSILAAAGYSLANYELGTSRDFRASTEAFYVADRGLNRYLGTDAQDLIWPVTYDFPEGEALVTVDTLTVGMENNESLFRVRSRGEHVPPAGDTARRTVAQVIMATPLVPVFPTGSFVSGGGIEQNGMSADYEGTNAYTGADPVCTEASVGTDDAASVVSDSFNVSGGGSQPGSCDSYTGATPDPTCKDDATSDFMSADQWQKLLDLEPDHTVAGNDSFPATDGYEVVKSSGDYTVDSDKTTGHEEGILIVQGDVTFNGDFTFDGLVLVGGRMKASNGKQIFNGGVITGLNELLGADPPENQIGNGTKIFQYNSCNIYKASTSKYTVSQVPASWYEMN